MVITHNMASMIASNNLMNVKGKCAKSSERLGSGYKLNRAADDTAGLAISEKMRAQIRGLKKASTNAQQGISYVQIADGALGEIHSLLHRGRELCIQAANDTNTSVDREAIQSEIDQLSKEVDNIAANTQFNSMPIFETGGAAGSTSAVQADTLKLQVGALPLQGVDLNRWNLSSDALNINGVDVSNYNTANAALEKYDTGIKIVSEIRSYYGAIQNRLEHAIANVDNTAENTQAAESLIRDTNMADEITEHSKNSILAQVGESVLAQANHSTEGVLTLLK